MNVILNGLSVLMDNWKLVIGILTIVLAGQFVMTVILQSLFGDRLNSPEYLSLGLAGWIVPIVPASLIWILWGVNHETYFGLFLAVVIFFSLRRFKAEIEPASLSRSIVLAFLVFPSLILRLAYVSEALFPSYFDSAQHYAMIKNIMTQDLSQVFATLNTSYYHFGFHFFTAFLTSILQPEITTAMLMIGQVFLAFLPIPSFFVVKYVTKSDWAGMFAVVLSAFGWYMPAHAVDWGKYPALMSMGMILFVLSLAGVLLRNKSVLSGQKQVFLYGVLGAGILMTAFVHSRSVIVLGIVAIAWTLSIWWSKLSQIHKNLIFILLLFTIILEGAFIEKRNILSLLFDPYLHQGIWITVLVLCLSAFAYKFYPQIVFTSFLAICLLLASIFVPLTGLLPGRDHLTLMDRPYVEMILFMPLSLLGGLGLAGLKTRIRRLDGRTVSIICIGLVLFHAFASYDFYPFDCCVLVGNDDVAAMAWMEDQLPVDARIGIASTEIKVVAADVVEGYAGSDAGIWITPLMDRVTIPLPRDLDFDQQSSLEILCRRGISHLYVGELGQAFDIVKLNSRPLWHRHLLSMAKAGVYEVIGCD
jgi:hypothetical protein